MAESQIPYNYNDTGAALINTPPKKPMRFIATNGIF